MKCRTGSSICMDSRAVSKKNPALSGLGARTSLTVLKTEELNLFPELDAPCPLLFPKYAPGG